MWNPFTSKPCLACLGKDLLLVSLTDQLTLLKSQLAHSREREEKAVDALLEKQGVQSVTPRPRMTMKDSETAMRQAMGIFIDEDDDGSGNILDADKLNVERSPLL